MRAGKRGGAVDQKPFAVTKTDEEWRKTLTPQQYAVLRGHEIEAPGAHGRIEIVAEDRGPGIPDIDRAMEEGFSTVGSLGLGLQGARRLVDEFRIESTPGNGTTIEVVKWV